MSSAAGKLVCVTGASGYIASWIVKFLLQRGYTVRASVRDPNDPKRTNHLVELDGAKERLHLFKANLLEEGSFDAAIQGSDGVFHTASPFYHDVKDPQDPGPWCWIHVKSVPIDDEFFCLVIKRTLDIGVDPSKEYRLMIRSLD